MPSMSERISKNLFAILGRWEKSGHPQLEKLITRMKTKELGMNPAKRISKVKMPLFMTQARKLIAGGANHTWDIIK